ncbi:MAG: hypothetical protein EOP84_04980 [Verrucomicrobiaceae bacterium]|nr:MAG: hypothetical protein EOP84_04980 [Verrucomicrobiaceae bacterium]
MATAEVSSARQATVIGTELSQRKTTECRGERSGTLGADVAKLLLGSVKNLVNPLSPPDSRIVKATDYDVHASYYAK